MDDFQETIAEALRDQQRHANYIKIGCRYPEKDWPTVEIALSGAVEGVGKPKEKRPVDQWLVVISCDDGTPSQRAQILAADHLLRRSFGDDHHQWVVDEFEDASYIIVDPTNERVLAYAAEIWIDISTSRVLNQQIMTRELTVAADDLWADMPISERVQTLEAAELGDMMLAFDNKVPEAAVEAIVARYDF